MGMKPRKTPERAQTLTRSIRLKIKGPVGASWEEVGPPLHSLSWVAPRLLDAAVLEYLLAKRERRKPDRSSVIKAELAEIKRHTKNPHTRALSPSGSLLDHIGYRAQQQAQNYLKKRFQQPMRIPSARSPGPIYVRDGQWRLEINGHLAISMKLSGGRSAWHRFSCAPLRGPHWEIVRALAAGNGGHKAGDCKLRYDKKTKSWQAIITVTSPAPAAAPGRGVIAVHRGAHNFLYYMTTGGDEKPLIPGRKLANYKRKMKARKRALQKAKTELGSGARGHGKKRREAAHTAIGDKEARFVHTYCQQAAAAVVRVAKQRGCGTVLLEDFGGIAEDEEVARYIKREGFDFPYFQLAEAIKWAAKKEGLRLEFAAPEYISTTCPRCDNQDDRQHRYDGRDGGTFTCRACGLKRAADFVATLHLLRRYGEADMTVWDRRFRASDKLARAARGENA